MRAPKVNSDGSTTNCIMYIATPSSGVGSAAGGLLSVDCSGTSNILTGAGAAFTMASGVLGLYSQYRYNKCTVEFIPSVGPASGEAGARIHIAYIDNAEKMSNFRAATSLAFVRGCKNVKTFNAWERFTYRVPLTWRRKWFDTNVTTAYGVDEMERSTQGMVIFFIETIAASQIVGTFKVDTSIATNELNLTLTT
jgi:hypothetical protein